MKTWYGDLNVLESCKIHWAPYPSSFGLIDLVVVFKFVMTCLVWRGSFWFSNINVFLLFENFNLGNSCDIRQKFLYNQINC